MAIVKKYPAKVVAIHNSIDGVYTLILESLNKPFKFDPGQFLHLALDDYDPAGQWPDSRCFSMQSSPSEYMIKITYAVKGVFTYRMQQQLKIGSEVTLKLPYGDLFTQPHNKVNTVFIAGGTGITPFLSLFNHYTFSEYINPILFVGFRSRNMNLYEVELEKAQKINSHFNYKPFYQDESGILNIEKIIDSTNKQSAFFISGPPAMIKSFKQVLINEGIPANQVLTDDWE
ncbi:MAG: FAD-dependent oxidoreductase [Bacteroidales bacterium]|nr:FAD-dependent oxidoreductase [Bacteroidales bacterium]